MARRTRLQDSSTDQARFNILNPEGAFSSFDPQPGSLQQHCRTFILQAVGLKRLARIVDLPIPKTMINYLANQLTVDDFFVNRNNLSSENMLNCVYPAKCLLDMSEVLLKCVMPCLVDDHFQAAMEAWKDVNHPNIMRSFLRFHQGGTEIIVFEYPPVSLEDIIRERRELRRHLPEYLIWKAFCELCSAMKYLNEKGIFYKTAKATKRISFDEHGNLKLDSGLLYQSSPEDTMNDPDVRVDGAGFYSPPEVMKGHAFGPESQVWLLGCLLYEITALEPAYQVEGNDMFTALANIMEGRPPPDINENFSDELKATIRDCVKGDPDQRPSMEELMNSVTMVKERIKHEYQGPEIVDL